MSLYLFGVHTDGALREVRIRPETSEGKKFLHLNRMQKWKRHPDRGYGSDALGEMVGADGLEPSTSTVSR